MSNYWKKISKKIEAKTGFPPNEFFISIVAEGGMGLRFNLTFDELEDFLPSLEGMECDYGDLPGTFLKRRRSARKKKILTSKNFASLYLADLPIKK